MKTVKFLALIITIVALTYAAPAVASGHSSHHSSHHGSHHDSHFSFGLGFWDFSPGIYGFGYGWGYDYWDWPGYHSYYYPSVVVAPPVIVQRPVVIKRVQNNFPPAQKIDFSGLEGVRAQKDQLLNKLNSSQKADKLQAISELAGYSFDDTVRSTLERILLLDPDPDLRKAVADSFGKVKNQGVLPTLERVRIADSDVTVRQAADNAINRIKS